MAEFPRPGSSSNKTKGYYREEDVLAAFERYLNPLFLQRILETIPVHNVRLGSAQRNETNKPLIYL
jgi:hypothetical protein